MTENFFQFQQAMRKPAPAPAKVGAEATALSVSELTARITQVIKGGFPATVLVRGEVSNWKPNAVSGHLYFTLKDDSCCLECVMFKSDASRLKFQGAAGIEVLASGRVGVYGARGQYQLQVSTLRPLGQGALELAFQQVKRKLEAEGLFARERKKPIPVYPRRVVMITSRGAAGLHDMLKVLRPFHCIELMLYHVPVQGDGAAGKIAAAIGHVNATLGASGKADVILLGRGGGSLEDLWCFNEEVVARAIAASRLPIVSGIGHQVDVSIADLMADYHAHTPTEAAQVITARWRMAAELLNRDAVRIARAMQLTLDGGRQRLRAVERHETFRRPMDRVNLLRQRMDEQERMLSVAMERQMRGRFDRLQSAAGRMERMLPAAMIRLRSFLDSRRQRLDQLLAIRLRSLRQRMSDATAGFARFHPRLLVRVAGQRVQGTSERLDLAERRFLQNSRSKLDALAKHLEAISPLAVLQRGYTITSRKKDGQPIRNAGEVKEGDRLVTRFADGQVESIATDSKQLSLFE